MVVDSSVEFIENSEIQTTETMRKNVTLQNGNCIQNDKSRISVKDRLGLALVSQNSIQSSTPSTVSFATPSVPKLNVQISIEPTENEVTTRKCTITSSSTSISIPSGESSKANDFNDREVTKVEKLVTNSETQPPKPFQITFTNNAVPLTTVAMEVKKDVATTSTSVLNGTKRRREDSDVILIDETFENSRRDDSVIFVSESINTCRPIVPLSRKRKGGPLITFGSDYIPVTGAKRDSPPKKRIKTKSTRAQRKTDKKAERRLALVEKNRTQQPSCSKIAQTAKASKNEKNGEKKVARDPNQLEKRMVIIDGSNVAFGHGGHNFSVKGIELCLNYFLSRGFEAKAVVPQMRIKANKSTDPKRLNELANTDKVLLTPCKNLPGKRAISYDDRIILDIAAGFDAAIISNDNYADLIDKKPEWDEIIKNRVVGFTWCNDLIIFPDDPYGRLGQTLNEILHKTKVAKSDESTSENIEKKSE